jgi:hypothetical protein
MNFPSLLWYPVSVGDERLADCATANITKRLQGGLGGGKVVVVKGV